MSVLTSWKNRHTHTKYFFIIAFIGNICTHYLSNVEQSLDDWAIMLHCNINIQHSTNKAHHIVSAEYILIARFVCVFPLIQRLNTFDLCIHVEKNNNYNKHENVNARIFVQYWNVIHWNWATFLFWQTCHNHSAALNTISIFIVSFFVHERKQHNNE